MHEDMWEAGTIRARTLLLSYYVLKTRLCSRSGKTAALRWFMTGSDLSTPQTATSSPRVKCQSGKAGASYESASCPGAEGTSQL